MNKSAYKPMQVLLAVTGTTALMLLGASDAWSQQKAGKNPLVGTWTVVSQDTTGPDGKKFQAFGADPKGILTFDANGRYALQICNSSRPKFASNVRTTGTADENRAAVSGCNPHWGRYSVSDGAINFKIEHALFPNWEGTEQKRPFTIKGDVLKYVVPASSTGGTAELVWKRAK